MAYCITLSTAATKTAYQRFGDAYISALSQAVPGLNVEQCQAILSDVVATVGRKAPKEKKACKRNREGQTRPADSGPPPPPPPPAGCATATSPVASA